MILSPGFQTFNPTKYETYHYSRFPNVVTSLEFERILSASGPFGGHLVRPSDHKEPKKIAWLQCVGSRDVKYSYLLFLGLLHVRHQGGGDRQGALPDDAGYHHLFHGHADLRQGLRAVLQPRPRRTGVRFIRSRIHTIDPLPDDNLHHQVCR